MKSIKLEVDNKIYDKLIWLLNQFKSEELRIIDESNFNKQKNYLNNQLNNIDTGKENFQSLDDLDESLEVIISEYEN